MVFMLIIFLSLFSGIYANDKCHDSWRFPENSKDEILIKSLCGAQSGEMSSWKRDFKYQGILNWLSISNSNFVPSEKTLEYMFPNWKDLAIRCKTNHRIRCQIARIIVERLPMDRK